MEPLIAIYLLSSAYFQNFATVKSFQEIANPAQRLGDTLTSTTPGLFNPQQKLPKGKLYSREDIAANIAQIKATVSLDKVNKALIESQK